MAKIHTYIIKMKADKLGPDEALVVKAVSFKYNQASRCYEFFIGPDNVAAIPIEKIKMITMDYVMNPEEIKGVQILC